MIHVSSARYPLLIPYMTIINMIDETAWSYESCVPKDKWRYLTRDAEGSGGLMAHHDRGDSAARERENVWGLNLWSVQEMCLPERDRSRPGFDGCSVPDSHSERQVIPRCVLATLFVAHVSVSP